MKYDVVAMGELLVDFTGNGLSPEGNLTFEANPGGAPCNVLAMLAKLGKKTCFMGKIGSDFLGDELAKALKETGISDEGLVRDPDVPTTLAFVHKKEDGDREFSFYRNPGADMMYSENDINESIIENCKVFHFGTLSMTSEGNRRATVKALQLAKKQGKLITFDPNLREPLWKSLDDAKEQVLKGLQFCDILKISDNEIQWLTGEEDFDRGVLSIRETFDIPLILVSMGKEGSRAYFKDEIIEAPAIINEDTVDTTGAGDTFFGCIIYKILEKGALENLDQEYILEMIKFANAAASIITTRKGALKKMPEMDEIMKLMES